MNLKFDFKTQVLKLIPGIQTYRFRLLNTLKNIFVFLRYLPGSSIHFGPPRGIHLDVDSCNISNCIPEKLIFQVLIKSESFCERNLPGTNSRLVIEKFKKSLIANIPEKRAYLLTNARYIYGNGGTVIASDDKIFIPCSPLKNEWDPNRHQSLYKLKLPRLVKFDKVILIDTKCSQDNYAHWMMDHLPRFFWLGKMKLDLSQYTLVSSFNQSGYGEYSYKILLENGFNFANIVYQNVNHFCCDELVIPPYVTPALNQDNISRDQEEISFLNTLFVSNLEDIQPYHNRIYLSRRRSIRTFPDEATLASKLELYEIKEIFLEDYNISEQAIIFKNATLIVGIHGAGFTNLTFCRPGTTVIELFGPDFIVTDYWSMANQLNLNYVAYCDDKYKKNIDVYRVARTSISEIDIDNFIRFLEQVLRT